MHEYQDLVKEFLLDLYHILDIDLYTLLRLRFTSPNLELIFRVGFDKIYSSTTAAISRFADHLHIKFTLAQPTHVLQKTIMVLSLQKLKQQDYHHLRQSFAV